ncbi:class I SAM-dependent methyltransferase [Streptomyces spiramenti]|uniref:Class I SAM-dependent methyltransferase n=1 Tax=Streptomyces spiramenti TaxID=2720606 RepID=A0ABX1ALZ2_9ACTN|nr:class I SAM-dependent methyltransferase [Streptomyces spiramenti]NJP66090.1 class I SAM-dependent methyltransferase [Streptomyces spiramenti]
MTHAADAAAGTTRTTAGAPQPEVLRAFRAARGFMPEDEGLALYAAATGAASLGLPLLEIGSYCGRSTVLLAAAARAAGTVVVTVDHHRGSEEQQPGWEYHDKELVDPAAGRIDTLPFLRATLHRAGLEDHVVAVVGRSPVAAAVFAPAPRFGLVFVDGGHTDEHATADYEGWVPQLAPGGLLVVHDVFEDPADGGQAPYRIWRRACDSGDFSQAGATRSLRVLRRTGGRNGGITTVPPAQQ